MSDKLRNYSDIYFSCYIEETKSFDAVVTAHSLLYIASGELQIFLDGKKTTYKKGDTIFIRRNHNIKMIKKPASNGEPFKSTFFMLHKEFLKEHLKLVSIHKIENTLKLKDITKVTDSPLLTGLFSSLHIYFDSDTVPSDNLIRLKKEEALNALLQTDDIFYVHLFDFSDPWKPDIEEFVNKNFRDNLSIEEMAGLTARSIATFKRDFQKIFDTTPQRWIIKKRLDEAHRLIVQENLRSSDIYLDLGFKNLAHFSTAFKKKFGATPNLINK